MATIFSTLSVNLSVSYELNVPDDWSDEQIEDYLSELSVGVTVDPDDLTIPDDVTVEGFSLDGAEVTYRDHSRFIEGA